MNESLSNDHFGCCVSCIRRRCPNDPRQIRFFHTIIVYKAEMSYAEPGQVFRQQASDAAKSNDSDAASGKLRLTRLSEHSELAVMGVRRVDKIPPGRRFETLDLIAYHGRLIKAQATTRWKPKVRLNGASPEDKGADWHASGNL